MSFIRRASRSYASTGGRRPIAWTPSCSSAPFSWLRGEPDHCSMAAIPTLTEEDAKRPGRERESLVGERTRIINRIKGALVRLGIREFKPMLRSAPQLLETLRTRKAPLCRRTRWPSYGATWLASALSDSRLPRLRGPASNDCSGHPENEAMRRSTCSPGWSGSASRRPICWYRRFSLATCGIAKQWHDTPV
jgi:hypothetical protein